jgi:tetratricopeptide (TPR) repeat protein
MGLLQQVLGNGARGGEVIRGSQLLNASKKTRLRARFFIASKIERVHAMERIFNFTQYKMPHFFKLTLSILLFFTTLYASACLNEYDETLDRLVNKRDINQVKQAITQLEKAYETSPTHELANDLGVALVMAGRYSEAEKILRAAENSKPAQPKTAFNLGTALELAGKNDEALFWIYEGLRRDPHDHQKTEWLHAKILEAKIHLSRDPDWLVDHTVLGLTFGTRQFPEMPQQAIVDATGKRLTLREIQTAIEYQLHERLKFVASSDPVVGDLFAAWGDIAWLTGLGTPSTYYQAAQYFEAKNELVIASRLVRYGYQQFLVFGLMVFVGATLLIAVAVLWRRPRLRTINQPRH